jgi:hypothetical protein
VAPIPSEERVLKQIPGSAKYLGVLLVLLSGVKIISLLVLESWRNLLHHIRGEATTATMTAVCIV